MSLKTFKRGVHPYDGKELSQDCAIKPLNAPTQLVFPLSQSIGAPSKACVQVGERVLKGQMIAEAGGYVSAVIHSSVSGTVKTIEERLVVNGSRVQSIVIDNDGLNETVSDFKKERGLDSLGADEITEIIKNSGIVGLGGAGFPTSVKLSPKNSNDIDTVIINAAECEPYITADYRLIIEKSDDLIKGVKAILKLFPNAKAVIGIENNKPEAIKLLEEKCSSEELITVQPLKTKYPQGGERQLIYAVTKRKINSKILPADKGCVVVNAASCYAIYEAVYLNMPLVHRIVTVSGDGVNACGNFDVPLGCTYKDVVDAAGGVKDDAVKLISGGPMMGTALSTLDVPIVKTSSAIVAFNKDDVAVLGQSNCIHCGKCLSVCPVTLVPQMMAKAVKANDFEKFADLGGTECIECGCCTYICPAKIPLTQMFKLGKIKVREMQKK